MLKDGDRLWRGISDLLPRQMREKVDLVAGQVGWTLGACLRGQLLVAAVDAVFIGRGLWLLGVPLAFASGLVAVLVASADGGLVSALLVLALIVLVQQLKGNVLEPLVLSRVIALHPLVITLSISVGAVALGVLGAFLAVPAAASAARWVDYVRDREPDAGPGWGSACVRPGRGSPLSVATATAGTGKPESGKTARLTPALARVGGAGSGGRRQDGAPRTGRRERDARPDRGRAPSGPPPRRQR